MNLSRRRLLAGTAAAPLLGRSRRARAAGATIRVGVLTDLSGQYRDSSGPTSVLPARQAVEDFGPERHGFHVENPRRRSPAEARCGRRHRPAVVRPRPGRRHRRPEQHRDRAGGRGRRDGEGQGAAHHAAPASADLTGRVCSLNLVHWAPDTWGDSHSTGNAILRAGGKTWFLIAADYTFGRTLEREVSALVQAGGGKVLGTIAYPFPGTTDFSSFLLQAQASGADVVALCNTGGDMENSIKQAHEFGLARNGKTVAAMFGFITEVKALGLESAKACDDRDVLLGPERPHARLHHAFPAESVGQLSRAGQHAGCYSAVLHYMKAVAAMRPEKAQASRPGRHRDDEAAADRR